MVTAPRRGPLLPTLVILFTLAVLLSGAASVWTEILWFDSVGFRSVFMTELGAKLVLGILAGLLAAGVVGSSLVLGYRTRPIYAPSTPEQESLDRYREAIEPLRRLATVAVPLMVGLLVGVTASTQWQTYLLWVNRKPFGKKDPQFGLDIEWFVFTVPWLNAIIGLLSMVLIAGAIAAVFTHYVYGGVQLTGSRHTMPAARLHLSALLAGLALTRAAAYWLERFGLTTQTSGLMTGIQYTDATAVLPTKAILAVASLMCALMFLSVIWTQSWRLPIIGVVLLGVIAIVVGNIYPALIQSLKVKPSEKSLEEPYIARNIAATRDAFGIAAIDRIDYKATTTATPAQLRADAETVPGIRIVDPNVVAPTFKQKQLPKAYYTFPDTLDVDRYVVEGTLSDAVVAVRELDLDGVPAGQRNWLNDHTVYTHGYGMVAAYGNRRGSEGEPVFFEGSTASTGPLGEYEPRIYFGEQSPSYSIVGAPSGASQREFDYPGDTASAQERSYTYTGSGGVGVGSLARRVAYGIKYREANFLLSDAVNGSSRLLDYRTPKERVEKVAPWLTLDGNVYPAVVDGRVQWIVDGYTTTASYPNSRLTAIEAVTEDSVTRARTSVTALEAGQINYIRNSVKATVDAYDGTVHLYAWDEADPLLQAWMATFPGTVEPTSKISAQLMAHLRYPEDLFKVQRALLAKYHVTNPGTFYSANDFWRVPYDPTQELKTTDQPPYYLTIPMPGTPSPSFSLTTTFMPVGDREVLSGFLAVDANAGTSAGQRRAGYGKLRLLELPSDLIKGPGQVQNAIASSTQDSKDFTNTLSQFINLNRQQGSTVTLGNLLTVPFGGGVLYVEPIYVQAKSESSFPLSQAIVTMFGNKIAWAKTLDGSLDALFGGASTPTTPGSGQTPTPGTSPTTPAPGSGTALQQALADAQKAYAEAEAALKAGDFAAYGEAQKRLKAAITRAVAAQPAGGSATLTPTSSPTPTATATP